MSENGLKRDCLEFGDFRLYPGERLLLKGSVRIALTPRVLDLLIVLVTHHGELVSKKRLLEYVWQGKFVEEGNINRTISTLRKCLGEQANGNDFIETVPTAGYRFIAPVDLSEQTLPKRKSTSLATRPIFWSGAGASLLALVFLASSTGLFRTADTRQNNDALVKPTLKESFEPIRVTDDPGRHAYPKWTSDGRIRYQYYGSNKHGDTYLMSSTGTDRIRVDDIRGVRHGNLSPNGKRLLVWKYDDPALYLANADGSNEEKLPFVPGNLAWSADALKIVYQSALQRGNAKDFDLFTYDVVTKRIAAVTNNLAVDADPAFSPDGKQIVFASNRDGNFEIYLMNSDGSNVRRLTNHPAWESHPEFSPDGTQIVFNSNRENENNDVYIINTDGGNVTKLTNWDSQEEVGPGCWSPDGTQIALISDHSGNDDVYVMNVEPFHPRLVFSDGDANIGAAMYSPDGKHLVYQAELADKSGELRIRYIDSGEVRSLNRTANANLRPVWSADGTRIVFQNKIEGQTDLFSIDKDGGNLSNLTNDPTSDATASWSPDGTKIVYVLDNYGQTRIYTIDLASGERRPLSFQNGWEGDPVWSPGGTKIAFECDREDVSGNGLDICLMDADGQNGKRLLSRRSHDIQPYWSPDGNRLAFVASSDGNAEIYVINIDGSGLLRLTRSSAEDSMPHWTPDGSKIIFSSNRSGRSAIYEIALK